MISVEKIHVQMAELVLMSHLASDVTVQLDTLGRPVKDVSIIVCRFTWQTVQFGLYNEAIPYLCCI